MTDMTSTPITLSELVAEGFAPTIDDLAARLDGSVFLDDLGRRCIARDVARQLFTERAEQQAAQAAKAAQFRSELAAMGNPAQDRVRAIQARQDRLRREGRWSDELTAAENLIAADGADDPIDRATRNIDEMRAAERAGLVGTGATFPRFKRPGEQ